MKIELIILISGFVNLFFSSFFAGGPTREKASYINEGIILLKYSYLIAGP